MKIQEEKICACESIFVIEIKKIIYIVSNVPLVTLICVEFS